MFYRSSVKLKFPEVGVGLDILSLTTSGLDKQTVLQNSTIAENRNKGFVLKGHF